MSTIELNNLTFTYPERPFSLDVEDKHFADPMVAIVGQINALQIVDGLADTTNRCD